MGNGGVDVVDHDGHRAFADGGFRIVGFPGQGVDRPAGSGSEDSSGKGAFFLRKGAPFRKGRLRQDEGAFFRLGRNIPGRSRRSQTDRSGKGKPPAGR